MSSQSLSQVFAFDDTAIRTAGTSDRPLFVAGDICKALGLDNVSRALASHPEDEKGITQSNTLGGVQDVLAVTEPGLYRLIFRSDKPEAERFRAWVFKEVLPAIRRTGQFAAGSAADRDALWKAYHSAKTGKVQLAVLEMLGFGAAIARVEAGSSPNDLVEPVNAARFWGVVAIGIREGTIKKEWFRVKACVDQERTGVDWFQLFILPEPVIAAVKASDDVLRHASRTDVRAGLSAEKEWMGGKHTLRFGDEPNKCWGFEVTKNSSVTLLQICAVLFEQQPTSVRN